MAKPILSAGFSFLQPRQKHGTPCSCLTLPGFHRARRPTRDDVASGPHRIFLDSGSEPTDRILETGGRKGQARLGTWQGQRKW